MSGKECDFFKNPISFDPSRFAVEILQLLWANRTTKEINFTTFEFKPEQFMVEGEAPSGDAYIQFAEKLKKEPGLGSFAIEAGPPTPLPTDHVKFRIFGKYKP